MLYRLFQNRGWSYGWVVAGVSFTTLFLVLGFRFSFGVLYAAILEDTGWLRAETSAIFSAAMGVYALTSVLSGAVFDWLGPRRMFPLAGALLVLGMVLCSTIDHLWEFYLYYGVLVGIGFSFLGFIPHMANVSRWFHEKRGAASAFVLSGIGIGSLVMSVLAEELVASVGWRRTLLVSAALVAVVVIPSTAWLHRDAPPPRSSPPEGPGQAKASGVNDEPFAAVFGKRAFWLLFVAVSNVGLVTMTLVVHQTRLLVDMGYSFALAAGLFGLTGLMRSLGGLIWGPLSDRIGRRRCVFSASAMGMLGIVALMAAQHTPTLPMLFAFILLFGTGFAGVTPVYVATAADHFAGRHTGKIFGVLDLGFGVGSSGGPWLAGYIFDRTGTYGPALWILLGGIAVSGSALWAAAGLRKR